MPRILPFLILVFAPGSLWSQAQPTLIHGTDIVGPGRYLMTDGGYSPRGAEGMVFVVSEDGRLLHYWRSLTEDTHSSERISMKNGEVLVADTGFGAVFRLAADGEVLWRSDWVEPFSDGSSIDFPNDADPLPNGNYLISDRDNHRVFEMDEAGTIYWQFGETGVAGSDSTHLDQPHNPDRLPNGNTIIADSKNNRVLEVDPAGNIFWSFGPTSGPDKMWFPRDVDLLQDGTVLIADSKMYRLLIVDRLSGIATTRIPLANAPFDADLMPDGSILVGIGRTGAVRVDVNANVLWQYPTASGSSSTDVWVPNPTSGVSIWSQIQVPTGLIQNKTTFPAIVFVPDVLDTGVSYKLFADRFARCGFVTVIFDPDGRGQSTNGGTFTQENYDGFLHQDGLHEVLKMVAARPEVDSTQIVVLSRGFGNTMASGALARYPNDPPIAAFLDWEGPATRAETAIANGGFIPKDPSNNAFWDEREALTFMPQIPSPYTRYQSQVDHFPTAPADNSHALSLMAAALRPRLGGAGISSAVRMNAPLDNPFSQLWSTSNTPVWIPEGLDVNRHIGMTFHLMVQSALDAPVLTGPGFVSLGSAATYSLDGHLFRAQEPFLVSFSASLGASPLPTEGWAGLVMDSLFKPMLRRGRLDSAGLGAVTYSVPSDPALLGAQVFTAAVVGNGGWPVPWECSAVLPVSVQ